MNTLEIDDQKIITIYTKCGLDQKSEKIRDHYLFKMKDGITTLSEKHGDEVRNLQSNNSTIEQQLKDFIKISSNKNDIIDDCKYFVKCGVKASQLYPTAEEVLYLDKVLISFIEPDTVSRKW